VTHDDDDDMTMMMMMMTWWWWWWHDDDDDDDGLDFAKFQHQVALATKLCSVATDICGSSAGNLFPVNFLVSRNLRWFLQFWKICDPWWWYEEEEEDDDDDDDDGPDFAKF